MTTGSAAVQIFPAALTVSVQLPGAIPVKANWPVVDVVAEYSRLLSAANTLMAAMSMGFPAGSRRIPRQEGGGEEWREGIRTNTMTRKKARASGRDQECIERHYNTRADFEDDRGASVVTRFYGD